MNCLPAGSSPSRYSHQYWAPVVANHFPPTSPFTQGQNLGYTLLPQAAVQFSPPPRTPFLSHQPLTRQRSGGASGDYTLLPQTPKLERKRSKKGTREVSSRASASDHRRSITTFFLSFFLFFFLHPRMRCLERREWRLRASGRSCRMTLCFSPWILSRRSTQTSSFCAMAASTIISFFFVLVSLDSFFSRRV